MNRSLALASLAALVLTGCENTTTPFSGSASMRVEVEVYRGPLSKDPEAQWGEFVGTLHEFTNALEILQNSLADTIERLPRQDLPNIITTLINDIDSAQDSVGPVMVAADNFNRKYFGTTKVKSERSFGLDTLKVDRKFVESQQLNDINIKSISDHALNELHEKLPISNFCLNGEENNQKEDMDYKNPGDNRIQSIVQRFMQTRPGYGRVSNNTFSCDIPGHLWGDNLVANIEVLLEYNRQCDIYINRTISNINSIIENTKKEISNPLKQIAYLFLDQELKRKNNIISKCSENVDSLKDKQRKIINNGAALITAANYKRRELTAPDEGVSFSIEESRHQARNVLMAASKAAQNLKNKALLIAQTHVAFALDDSRLRRFPVSYSNILATYADRVGLRADTLLKQLKGDDRRELPLSVALRETNSPAYLKQYLWNDAIGETRTPTEMFRVNADQTARERIRGIEQLFADENWSNVNTVHASGQGTVRMALIKDDIGNWGLKNFDNDPTELLNAYKEVTKAGIAAAASIASKLASGGATDSISGAKAALQFANQVAFGQADGAGPTLGAQNLAELHASVSEELGRMREAASADLVVLRAKIRKAEAERDVAKGPAENQKTTDAALKAAEAKRDAASQKRAEAEREQQRAQTLKQAADGLDSSSPAKAPLYQQSNDAQSKADQLRNDASTADISEDDLSKARVDAKAAAAALAEKQRAIDDLRAEERNFAKARLATVKTLLDRQEAIVDALAQASTRRRTPSASRQQFEQPTTQKAGSLLR